MGHLKLGNDFWVLLFYGVGFSKNVDAKFVSFVKTVATNDTINNTFIVYRFQEVDFFLIQVLWPTELLDFKRREECIGFFLCFGPQLLVESVLGY